MSLEKHKHHFLAVLERKRAGEQVPPAPLTEPKVQPYFRTKSEWLEWVRKTQPTLDVSDMQVWKLN